eukprot:CAMPEP_0114624552 /NCGR_PEP_ID=MMETSP0168-20121206/10823_1 /TAXON_ID=95228 ORGANISM="Vannella sp., Strain DIVA3 517/6/12" /NCGR_SAMPLE_ID=MMETSP0168 /ASSEMBLY_ACC=CAM_ASM_000044 /LENGTH=487 /DNA_ID=CAMNT_0001835825 /DNA_START=28 /DNA_END=1488 /DNA_ORIENTATION=+
MPSTELTDQDLVNYLAEHNQIEDSRAHCEKLSLDHDAFVGTMNSLLSLAYITSSKSSTTKWVLTDEGTAVIENGSPEYLLYQELPSEGTVPIKELAGKLGKQFRIAQSNAVTKGWIFIAKGALSRKAVVSEDSTADELRDLSKLDEKALAGYKKRKLVKTVQVTRFAIGKGPEFSLTIVRPSTELTTEMLRGDAWKQMKFKPLNIGKDIRGQNPRGGHLHTLLKYRSMIREIFLEMGFSEMPTNNYVESSFWNFDSLFQPQGHAARDAHDTFFLKEPQSAPMFLDEEYAATVKATHEDGNSGNYGSLGWRYDWSSTEAKRNLLRTHTTACSARMLYELGKQKTFTPKKYFSIDRVFRNETLDTTHLAEFHQIEGLVADYDLNLGNLMAIIKEFFEKLGIKKLRFKPAYNPYTEPSMEIFSWHEQKKKWLEIGNSGMFRPEMLLPMGLPDNVRVIAWGLSLERPVMIKYEYPDIRHLCGHKVRLPMIQ